jgi:membrane-associated protease RseP (regulator of RpoE activity)
MKRIACRRGNVAAILVLVVLVFLGAGQPASAQSLSKDGRAVVPQGCGSAVPSSGASIMMPPGDNVTVIAIIPDPGAAGALQPGDKILSVDGVAISKLDQVTAIVRTHQFNDEVTVFVLRNGQQKRVEVVLKKFGAGVASAGNTAAGASNATSGAAKPKPGTKEAQAEKLIGDASDDSVVDNFAEAIKKYSAAIALVPNNAEYYYFRGSCYRLWLGHTDEAIKDFNTALKLGYSSAGLYNDRGAAYVTIGDYAKAIQDFDKATPCRHLVLEKRF